MKRIIITVLTLLMSLMIVTLPVIAAPRSNDNDNFLGDTPNRHALIDNDKADGVDWDPYFSSSEPADSAFTTTLPSAPSGLRIISGLDDGTATPATLPQRTVDTTYSLPTGRKYTVCNSGCDFNDLQIALNSVPLNSILELKAGETYQSSGDNGFQLPNKTSGSGWIYIVSDALSNLPSAGNRVSPSDAVNMPLLRCTWAGNDENVITNATNAHHYRFVGIAMTSTNFTYEIVSMINASYIIFDRCYVYGNATLGTRRGFQFNVSNGAIVDSHISDFKDTNSDSQALWAHQTPGPVKIENSFLSGAGEVILFGGSDNDSATNIPQDITIKGNHFYWDPAWENSSWVEKNLIESKMSKRVLVEGNLFENHWMADGGQEYAVVIKSTDQLGGASNPWAETSHWTFRYNKFVGLSGRFVNLYHATEDATIDVSNVTFHDNLIIMKGSTVSRFMLIKWVNDVIFNHNTVIGNNWGIAYSYTSSTAEDFDFRNNIITEGLYNFHVENGGSGETGLNNAYKSYVWQKNALVGAYDGNWGRLAATNFFPANMPAVQFVNYTGDGSGNYTLSNSSPYKNAGTDGKDLGADIEAVNAGHSVSSSAILHK